MVEVQRGEEELARLRPSGVEVGHRVEYAGRIVLRARRVVALGGGRLEESGLPDGLVLGGRILRRQVAFQDRAQEGAKARA
jgi:hypothetical protein